MPEHLGFLWLDKKSNFNVISDGLFNFKHYLIMSGAELTGSDFSSSLKSEKWKWKCQCFFNIAFLKCVGINTMVSWSDLKQILYYYDISDTTHNQAQYFKPPLISAKNHRQQTCEVNLKYDQCVHYFYKYIIGYILLWYIRVLLARSIWNR